MEYFYLGQDNSVNPKQIRHNSIEDHFWSSPELTPIIIYENKQVKRTLFEFPSPKYGDIISGGGFSVYSDRVCEVLKTLDLDLQP